MSDLIDRKALLSKRGELAYCEVCPVWSLIKDAPTVAASPWRRVEEELPDKTGSVLVWVGVNYDGWGMYPEMRTALWHTVQKRFFVHHNESIRGPIIGEVTHWMPLPEPPKEDA